MLICSIINQIAWIIRFILIALSHIHVSAVYCLCIYENFDTPRSEPYFVRATYVPHTCDIPATFPWRISDVSLFLWNFTFVCTVYQGMCCIRVMFVWRVCVTYVLCMYYFPFLFAVYLFCTNCFFNNGCVHLHITVINYQRLNMPPEKSR